LGYDSKIDAIFQRDVKAEGFNHLFFLLVSFIRELLIASSFCKVDAFWRSYCSLNRDKEAGVPLVISVPFAVPFAVPFIHHSSMGRPHLNFTLILAIVAWYLHLCVHANSARPRPRRPPRSSDFGLGMILECQYPISHSPWLTELPSLA